MADHTPADDLDRLRAALVGTRFDEVTWVDETGSTNADLLAHADDHAIASQVLVADHQKAGRGRLDRTWEAPPGSSLLVSVLVRPALAPDEVHLVAHAVAVAAVDAVRAVGVDAGLKWPNDLVVETPDGTRKLAGILAESKLAGGSVVAVVVGIGLNVNWPLPLPLPDELTPVAIACNHVVGHDLDRVELLSSMLVNLDAELSRLDTVPGRSTLLTRYRDRCVTLGTAVRAELAGDTVEGIAVGIDDAGHLLVEAPGELEARVVTAGDVIHLRRRP
jgi:BirA family biotin operon repressor/biotin-[acetyl-CoA-carboxylase] ligase